MEGSPNPPNSAPRTDFPKSPSEFEDDDRVAFSKLDEKYILEAEDGTEYEWVDGLKRWVPLVDDALLEQQGEAYKVEGVDEDEPAAFKPQKRKRKNAYDGIEDASPAPPPKPKRPRVNTAVYVTSIPLDASLDELNDVFSKCGVIAEEIDRGRPRIKMYTDEKGNFKGDALVVYFRPESVNLAVQMLDDSDFRFGETGPQGKMHVQPADFSYKAQQEAPAKPKSSDKRKIIKKTQKLNNKLADWDDEDPIVALKNAQRWEKVVILKHMFTLQELDEDPAAILDIKEDIRLECEKLGEITNVVLYDKEEAGVASVRFSDPEAARACVRVMDGRFFAGTKVEAYIADGSERFKKSDAKRAAGFAAVDADEDAEEEEAKRLEEFGAWLEQEKEEKKES
ncbi:hypothetical protein AJ80_07273 [Polytolypa hystricis UAMH7299]|uniref:RRM domain-containing protein n=1 Tax=Polytolypa hystricis (strain UAMH7299) TaxID=1447883 RepID=A0A2B7XQ38_POLH7|nr:hypothetical protein AJ80_07273 [Polytolypa hystricis UAMH7299]